MSCSRIDAKQLRKIRFDKAVGTVSKCEYRYPEHCGVWLWRTEVRSGVRDALIDQIPLTYFMT